MSTTSTKVDAKSRAWRTFLQGFGIDIAVAVAAALLLWLPDADLSSGDAWLVLGTALGKTVLTTAAAYVMRLKVAPPAPVDADGDLNLATLSDEEA